MASSINASSPQTTTKKSIFKQAMRGRKYCKNCHSTFETSYQKLHLTHVVKDVWSSFEETREQLVECKEVLENDVSFLLMEKFKLQTLLASYQMTHEQGKKIIKDHETRLKNEITIRMKKLLDTYSATHMELVTSNEKQISIIEDQIIELRKTCTDIERVVEAGDADGIFKEFDKVKDFLETNEPVGHCKLPLEKTEFKEPFDDVFEKCMETLVGSLEIISHKDELSFTTIKSFETDCHLIDLIASSIKGGSLWIHSYYGSSARQIDLTNGKYTVLKEIKPLMVQDMTLMDNGDLFIAVAHQPVIKIQPVDGEMRDFYTFPRTATIRAQVPMSLHVSNENRLFVGTKEQSGYKYKLSSKSRRQVAILDIITKKIRQTFETDEKGDKLFTLPSRVASWMNGMLSVLDRTSRSTGRIITLDRKGYVKWLYNSTNSPENIQPRDMKLTSNGSLVIIDDYRHKICILDCNGQLLHAQNTTDIGIYYPYSISVDHTGNLLVGCSAYQNAHLHIVALNGRLKSIVWKS